MTPEEPTWRLFEAARSGNVSSAREALDAGANANATDSDQETPLHWAATLDQTDVACLLIDKGAEVNATDDWDQTPLHSAVAAGRAEMVKRLLSKGADPALLNVQGLTARHIANFKQYAEIAELLATSERWHNHVKPLLGTDNKLDARQLVDEAGRPTEALQNLLPNDLFADLARPEFYQQGINGLVLIYPHLPETAQACIDLTAYRMAKLQEAEQAAGPEGGSLKRYSRPRRIPSPDRNKE